ncbi:MAG: lysine N(6)-hydroxylase/L-ornithine N(5)-oxygenase family protein [Chloroflexales bacterium]|nr:lysine N(6)-hydroxylase/L-ornithine N(5)-oxygenase family protein [Chloroflexales bacterium]
MLVEHLYTPGFRRESLLPGAQTVVSGGGINAAQVAVTLAHETPGSVTLLLRHELRIAAFDSPAGWTGPKNMQPFLAEPCLVRHRAMIQAVRAPGSMPNDVAHSLHRAARNGWLTVRRGAMHHAKRGAAGSISLQLLGETLHTEHVILATGFARSRPGGAWLDSAIAAYELPLAPCGYPVIDRSLQWAPGLYVTDGLAELELGPVAFNIVCARHAAP